MGSQGFNFMVMVSFDLTILQHRAWFKLDFYGLTKEEEDPLLFRLAFEYILLYKYLLHYRS